MRKMIVVLEVMTQLPRRAKPEPIPHSYTVYARTRLQAVAAVRNAGHKGKLVEVRIGKES